MKKLFFFLAALTLSFTAQATVVNCNPGSNNLAWYLTQGDTLVLADGEYSEAYSIDFDKSGVCVKAAEGAKPVIKLTDEYTVLDVQATTTFEGITFDAGNVAKYLIATTGVNPGTLTINNCEFCNWTYWALSNQFEETASIDSVIIDNCLFHDGAEAAISFSNKAPEGTHSCNYFSLTNSTIYNVKSTEYAGIVHVSSNGEATGMQNKVIIDHVTMYNLDGGDLGIIAVRKSSDLTISNTIIANPAAGERASYVYGGVAENVVYYNVSQDGDLTYTNCLTDDPMFDDAANGNFALAEGSPALGAATDGSNLGDPRWNAPAVEEPKYNVVEDEITNFVFDTEAWPMVCMGGPSTNYQVEVYLVLTEDADGTLSYEDCSVSIMGTDATFIDGTLSNIDPYAPYADAVLHVQWDGDYYELQLAMSAAAPAEPIVVVVENATLDDQVESTGFFYMAGECTIDDVTYPVKAEIPGFDKTKAEAEYEHVMVEVGTWGGEYLGNATGKATVSIVDNVVILTGVIENAGAGVAFNVTISGTLPADEPEVPTALDNVDTTVAPVKAIVNGQLVIIRNGVQYNAQGAIVK